MLRFLWINHVTNGSKCEKPISKTLLPHFYVKNKVSRSLICNVDVLVMLFLIHGHLFVKLIVRLTTPNEPTNEHDKMNWIFCCPLFHYLKCKLNRWKKKRFNIFYFICGKCIAVCWASIVTRRYNFLLVLYTTHCDCSDMWQAKLNDREKNHSDACQCYNVI